jgi:hypothetical protein
VAADKVSNIFGAEPAITDGASSKLFRKEAADEDEIAPLGTEVEPSFLVEVMLKHLNFLTEGSHHNRHNVFVGNAFFLKKSEESLKSRMIEASGAMRAVPM